MQYSGLAILVLYFVLLELISCFGSNACSSVSEGLAALAFTGVEVNMVLFSKSVLRQSNADAAKNFSTWMGTLNMCTLLGAFLSDSYLGRYFTCVVFQGVLVVVSDLLT